MRLAALALAIGLMVAQPAAAQDRAVVDATPAQDIAVTVYRDPDRGQGEQMNRDWPQGFAMISEERVVTLPAGRSTIRFEGVAEGMVAVTAIVTGLPGGTIEKNRNADLLSPAALVDGTLGNRVRITRTNPGTGQAASESAIIRTRADGGLVLQTADGFEAVRCSGLPEKLTFDRVPEGLSAGPVFSLDTASETGGTYRVTLTYLAWGFDWQAHYVATLGEPGRRDEQGFNLVSWLTLVNDNNQTFSNAELMAVAGRLNVESDYEGLADPPRARPLRLNCYPIGNTAAGTPNFGFVGGLAPPPPPPPAPMMAMDQQRIVVTGQRREAEEMGAPVMMAGEEDLGDLKLYRVPEPVDVSAQSVKQVAFLRKEEARGRMVYRTSCSRWDAGDASYPLEMLLIAENEEEFGLGAALPMGQVTIFEPSRTGDLLVGEEWLRDHAVGQEVEISLGESGQVFGECSTPSSWDNDRKWKSMQVELSNANPVPVTVRLLLGSPRTFELRRVPGEKRLKDGQWITEVRLGANTSRVFAWQARSATAR